ncbi:hypothetical protein BJY04DRAFT_191380 [Aspergillus karnatakaensis]|uniref:putative GPI anchored protein n=1 Tax=Aspergillus karnatakaensis TaxID=1810916 RepID=UPI003CCD4626
MKFSFAAVAALLAVGAVAHGHAEEEEVYTTITVTDYTTYCAASTTLSVGTEIIPVETPGTVTLSNGPYTITRPLLTTTITRCKACSTPTGTPTPSVPVIPTSVPVIPSAPTDVHPTGPPASTTTPAAPEFTGGASRAAVGAGAVAGLFGVVAALL